MLMTMSIQSGFVVIAVSVEPTCDAICSSVM